MKKLGFLILSMAPWLVLAKEQNANIRITAKIPQKVENVMLLLQRLDRGIDTTSMNLNLNKENSTFELLVQSEGRADILVDKLIEVLGEDIEIVRISLDEMAMGSQDDFMKP